MKGLVSCMSDTPRLDVIEKFNDETSSHLFAQRLCKTVIWLNVISISPNTLFNQVKDSESHI